MTNHHDAAVARNREAWDLLANNGCRWSQPVDAGQIEAARKGQFQIVLTPNEPVPERWFPSLPGCETLCLACGGGQQAPILAAAGARVTVLDNSPAQLEHDRAVANREGLELSTIVGDMQSMPMLADASFDFVFQPSSIAFAPQPQRVWEEVARVLRPGGVFMTGFCNPLVFAFDYFQMEKGNLQLRHALPYSDLKDLSAEEQQRLEEQGEPVCFGHTLELLIGGQLQAGLQITDFYEDIWGHGPEQILDRYLKTMIATRAIKPLES